jgi:hypothetical protein
VAGFSSSRIVFRETEILRAVDEHVALGANRAIERLLAIVTPLTPNLEGNLVRDYGIHAASSASVFSEGAQLQNSSPYAVYQHEGMRKDGSHVVRKHTTDPNANARTKFVEVPMREARDELYGIVAAEIARGLA